MRKCKCMCVEREKEKGNKKWKKERFKCCKFNCRQTLRFGSVDSH
jgi:hypothetical protein